MNVLSEVKIFFHRNFIFNNVFNYIYDYIIYKSKKEFWLFSFHAFPRHKLDHMTPNLPIQLQLLCTALLDRLRKWTHRHIRSPPWKNNLFQENLRSFRQGKWYFLKDFFECLRGNMLLKTYVGSSHLEVSGQASSAAQLNVGSSTGSSSSSSGQSSQSHLFRYENFSIYSEYH